MSELAELHRVLAEVRVMAVETRADVAWIKRGMERGSERMDDHERAISSIRAKQHWYAGFSSALGALFGGLAGHFIRLMLVLALVGLGTPRALACGKERWPVKIASDRDAMRVVLTPQDTTIVDLSAIIAPKNPKRRNTSRFAPAELTVWKVSGTLTMIKPEADEDYHLVVEDEDGISMIVESPSPGCARHSRFRSQIAAVRQSLDARFPKLRKKRELNVPVTVTGIGFFDPLHGQEGVASNGIELHPLLSIDFYRR